MTHWKELVKIITRTGTVGKAKANITITKRIRRRGEEDKGGKRVTGVLSVHIIGSPNLQGRCHSSMTLSQPDMSTNLVN